MLTAPGTAGFITSFYFWIVKFVVAITLAGGRMQLSLDSFVYLVRALLVQMTVSRVIWVVVHVVVVQILRTI